MEEIWKDIPEYEGLYQVSNMGRVRSLEHTVTYRWKNTDMLVSRVFPSRILYQLTVGKYKSVQFTVQGEGKRFYVHRLVAKAFPDICGEWFEGCEVDHIDTNTLNNVATNLFVGTRIQNRNNPLTKIHSLAASKIAGLKRTYGNHPKAKPILQSTLDGKIIKEWDCIKRASEETGIDRKRIAEVISGKRDNYGSFKWRRL